MQDKTEASTASCSYIQQYRRPLEGGLSGFLNNGGLNTEIQKEATFVSLFDFYLLPHGLWYPLISRQAMDSISDSVECHEPTVIKQ